MGASERPVPARPEPAAFYARPAEIVAPALLGGLLVSTIDGIETSGRIVETEAYVGPHDPASHAAERIGRTVRNRSMFGVPGIAYVYRIYGVHWCLNIVTDRVEYPAAVLIRAIEPVSGIETMRRRRGVPFAEFADAGLGSGPGKLAAALGITGAIDGHPLDRPPLIVARFDVPSESAIARGPRVGITRAADWPLRFFIRGNPHVSKRGAAGPRSDAVHPSLRSPRLRGSA
ncbi:MAG: DNA-3-methyladenine glycosylase [Longimicrobiales bacterium]